MPDLKINKDVGKPLVVVAPLDWGLGHATRCIPIINHLVQRDIKVLIVASNSGYQLLKKEFPASVILRTSGYNISYGKNRGGLVFNLILQLPKFVAAYFKERELVKRIQVAYHPDLIISDNCFGFWHSHTTSIYITHQLNVLTGHRWLNRIASRFHRSIVKKFSACWVPDSNENVLAGDLSRNRCLTNVKYIGPISRFEAKNESPQLYQILFLISGPEPQRTIFEKIIVAQTKNVEYDVLIVRGLPGLQENLEIKNEHVSVKNHMPSKYLNEAILASELVISRSGYTTVMDLVKTRKKAVFVPTPGQKEQEYLAAYLFRQKAFLFTKQDKFDIDRILEVSKSFPFKIPEVNMASYKMEIDHALNKFIPLYNP